jgi:CRP-like cAMP-binding protein
MVLCERFLISKSPRNVSHRSSSIRARTIKRPDGSCPLGKRAVSSLEQSNISNGILSRLSPRDFQLIEPHLEHTVLPLRKYLERRNRRIEHVYFIESGFASVVAEGSVGPVEVGIIGYEGATGAPIILGADRSPHDTFMQAAGDGWCMRASEIRPLMRESATINEMFLRFVHFLAVQTAQTAFANGRSKIEERLARWLLMVHDRLKGGDLPLTHEFVGMMLGVRRAGVTVALNLLQNRGLIEVKRKTIKIMDRDGLRALCPSIYGIPEAEYKRLFGNSFTQ